METTEREKEDAPRAPSSTELKDKLLEKLIKELDSDELKPQMVAAIVSFLKSFPPEAEDMPTAEHISDRLKRYGANVAPFQKRA